MHSRGKSSNLHCDLFYNRSTDANARRVAFPREFRMTTSKILPRHHYKSDSFSSSPPSSSCLASAMLANLASMMPKTQPVRSPNKCASHDTW